MTAIYQWFVEEDITTVVTTTLYPAESEDAVELGISLVYGYMVLIPVEDYEFTIETLDGNITPILLTVPTEEEEYEFTLETLNGSITAILLTIPTPEEEYEFTIETLDGSITSKLVSAVMSDQAMNIGVSLVSGSMTPV
jgi:hypothetical protein